METLPIDIIRLTYEYLDDVSLAKACMVNSTFSTKICNHTFWINKIIKKFGLSIDDIDNYKNNNTYWAYYLFLSDKLDDDDVDDVLLDSSASGRIDLVKITLNRGANLYDDAITEAAFHGHDDIVKLILTYDDDDIDSALLYSVFGENVSTILLLLNRGADVNFNFGEPLRFAAERENLTITKLLLEHGADPTAVGYSDNPYINMLLDQIY